MKKRKPNAAERQLHAEWEALLKKHARPLDRGATNTGQKVVKPPAQRRPVVMTLPEQQPIPSKQLPAPLMSSRQRDEQGLAEAKHNLKWRAGQVFNKGGVQFMTDSDLADSKAGLLRRRS